VKARPKPNPVAKALRSPHLTKQVVRPAKGKGSYTRKPRTPTNGEPKA
jgi:stalled ribosome alternative rescue factor ArfA